ncbi:hypothetical protein [Streptomyces viridochromogenes]|uniref:hypothetical protein n=1 Tax=Streptomyces viridochromogenes TaxID=1938 RepID=UPI0031D3A42E
MHTPAAIATLAAGFLGEPWAAERGPWGVNGSLRAPETDTFTLHVDDHGQLCLESVFDGSGTIDRFPEQPTTMDEAVTTARKVAEAIRLHLADINGMEYATLNQDLNLEARFSEANYSDPENPRHPNITIAGGNCSFYVGESDVLCVSIHQDGVTNIGTRVWENITPMQITIEGEVVFASTGAWVVQFQHPEDGGDDCVWEFTIPAEKASTEAAARTVATTQLLAELNSHGNTDAWNGTRIRSVRFTQTPPVA